GQSLAEDPEASSGWCTDADELWVGDNRIAQLRDAGGVGHNYLDREYQRRQVLRHNEAEPVVNAAVPDQNAVAVNYFSQRRIKVTKDMGVHLPHDGAVRLGGQTDLAVHANEVHSLQ